MAKKINSPYIIDEQKDYIYNITEKKEIKTKPQDITLLGNELRKEYNELVEIDRIIEAHELMEQFKQKYAPHYNLLKISSVKECIERDEKIWNGYLIEQKNKVEKLDEFEKKFYQFLKHKDIDNADLIIERAWDHIYKLEGDQKEIYQNKWGTLEHNLIQGLKYEEYEKIVKFKKRIRKIIEDSKKFEENSQFNKAINILKAELNSDLIDDMVDLKSELEDRLYEIQTSRHLVDGVNDEIEALKNQLKQCFKENRLEEAVAQCNEIIKISQEHGLSDIKEHHEQLLKEMRVDIVLREEKEKFDILKEKVLKLNEEGLESLDDNDINKALGKYKEIKTLISNHINK
ncbi:MAG: hypothetical protein ACFFBP_00110 [Promethearchaeota archaeon]